MAEPGDALLNQALISAASANLSKNLIKKHIAGAFDALLYTAM